MTQHFHKFLAPFVVAAAIGCSAEVGQSDPAVISVGPAGQDPASMSGAIKDIVTAPPVMAFSNYYWVNGSPAKKIGRFYESYCWLTGVAGQFAGDSEAVYVTLDSNMNWILTGTNGHSGVRANATCAPWAMMNSSKAATVTYNWWEWSGSSPSEQDIPLLDYSNICHINGIAGQFGIFSGAAVYEGDTTWRGTVGTEDPPPHGGVGLVNQCVMLSGPLTYNTIVGYYQWNQERTTVDMGPTTDRACFLSIVSGNFTSYSDYLRIAPVQGRWLFEGHAGGGLPFGEAICFRIPQ
jgi:hypothetical protein